MPQSSHRHGDQVSKPCRDKPFEANDVVMVLESMKMEMQITAPRAAVVKSVLVIPGSSVKVNQLLVEFE